MLWALPPCASNRNQACREGFLGAWPGREPIICKRWGLGLSQELPESLLPVRASLRAAKSACSNRGLAPRPSLCAMEAVLSWKPGTAKQNLQCPTACDFWGWDCGVSYKNCFLSGSGQRHMKWGHFCIVWLTPNNWLPSLKLPSSAVTAKWGKRVRSFVIGEFGKV